MEGGSGRIEACWARERAKGESRRVKFFGKWFTEIFSVNRFLFFPSRFYGKKQTFSG